MKTYKSKCRYCGGKLYLHTQRDLNIIGEQGYTVSLLCDGCHNRSWLFCRYADMIAQTGEKLIDIYRGGK